MDKYHSRQAPLLLRAAADWWARLRDDDVSPDAAAEWQAWSAEDPGHTEAFERIRELGSRLEGADARTRHAFVAEFVRPRAPSMVRRFAVAASLAIVVLTGGYFAWNMLTVPDALASRHYATPIAVNRDVVLADGSKVALGGASAVQTQFGGGLRRVQLQRGEAYFEVAHDKRHPFIVSAGEIKVRAIGTAFNVRRTGDRVMVTVTEGTVQIAQGDASSSASAVAHGAVVAVAGQQVVYDPAASGLTVATVDTGQVLGWRNDRLQFVNEPLGVVVANINRYSLRPLRIADPKVNTITFTGTVSPTDLDGWAAALPHIFPVKVRATGKEIVIAARDPGRRK
jgi:transmembrane sensor